MRKIYLALIGLTFVSISCDKQTENEITNGNEDMSVPETFSIEIPQSISENSLEIFPSSAVNSLSKTTNSTKNWTVDGAVFYRTLRDYIHLVERTAKDSEFVLRVAKRIMQLDGFGLSEYTYTAPDGYQKKWKVFHNESFEGVEYQNIIRVFDLEADHLAFVIYWNSSPVRGVAIGERKYFNKDEKRNKGLKFRVDYNESSSAYEQTMVVSLTGLDQDRSTDPSQVKCFVGRTGDLVDLYGASNHPKSYERYPQGENDATGACWTFVASAHSENDISVAEVGITPNVLDSDDRDLLVKQFSLENYMLHAVYHRLFSWTQLSYDDFVEDYETYAADYFANCKAPAYFANRGFVQSETAPSAAYDELEERMNQLTPYRPLDISQLEINF